MQAEGLDQEEVGRDRLDEIDAAGIERQRREWLAGDRVHGELEQLVEDEDRESGDLYRPDASEPTHHVAGDGRGCCQSLRIGLSDDETAQHEEEVDEKGDRLEMAHGDRVGRDAEMRERDGERSWATQAVDRAQRIDRRDARAG